MNPFTQTALTSCDSYKLGHADQYPAGTEYVYSNFTPRANTYFQAPDQYKDNNIVWFGLQGFLLELNQVWQTTFFEKSWTELEPDIAAFYAPFVGPNGFNTNRLKALHELGFLPIKIKALPEATLVPMGVPVLTIVNTLPEFYWLTNFLETWLSSELWKSSTSATTSRMYRIILEKYASLTGGSKEFIAWQGHDFSVRGMSGIQDAAKSGAGHLLSFWGTDNLPAVKYINDCYGGTAAPFPHGSVPATEHSVMCASGKETELETFSRLLKAYPTGVISIVSDTWDFWQVITRFAVELKPEILARQPDAFGLNKIVFRPDSGDPIRIIAGYLDSEVEKIEGSHGYVYRVLADEGEGEGEDKYITPAEKEGAVQCLWNIFGGTTNAQGYKTLDQHIGLLYGDSITMQRAEAILELLMQKGFASDNVVFGIGSYTFQCVTRDVFGFAMKATHVTINGEDLAIFKSPKTDNGTKNSARGLLEVCRNYTGAYTLHNDVSRGMEQDGCLATVYENGAIFSHESFPELRDRLAACQATLSLTPA